MRIALLLSASLALAACLGSAGSEDTYADDSFDLQARYGLAPASDTPEFAAYYDSLTDDLADLEPPAELENEHDALVVAFERLADAAPEDSGRSPNADLTDAVVALEEAVGAWNEAFAEHYGTQHFGMEGRSMEPTFADGDHLKVPVYQGEGLNRGQIVVFDFHLNGESERRRVFIKRVIGLPGETIEVRDGTVLVDGQALTEDYLLNTPTYTYGPRTVPENHYFVLGDNRRNSFDSHQWAQSCLPEQVCDFVPRDNIIGVLPRDAKPYASTPD
jgi:signal peptidase I